MYIGLFILLFERVGKFVKFFYFHVFNYLIYVFIICSPQINQLILRTHKYNPLYRFSGLGISPGTAFLLLVHKLITRLKVQ